MAETPDDRADLPGRGSSLALTLRVRFERTGRLADLDKAVLARHVLRPPPAGSLGGSLNTFVRMRALVRQARATEPTITTSIPLRAAR